MPPHTIFESLRNLKLHFVGPDTLSWYRKLLLSMIEPGEGGTGRPVRRSYDIRCGYSGCPLSCEQPSVNERRSDAKKRQNMRGIGQINAVPMLIQF